MENARISKQNWVLSYCRTLIVSAVRYHCSSCWPHCAFASDNLNTAVPDILIIDAQTRQYELWYTTVPK